MSKMKQLAQDAIDVQNACNPFGVLNSYQIATKELRSELESQGIYGHSSICNHPIFRLWASKMHSLANMGLSDGDKFAVAYNACKKLAE